MAQISLDTSKLLGFRLLAESDRTASLGAKVGDKRPVIGAKVGGKPDITLGAKFGAKVGTSKIGAKVGIVKPPVDEITA